MESSGVRKKLSRMGTSYDADAMSGYNPHSHALVLRSDRVDYSVTKGGLRVWIALVVFILFVGGIISIISDGDMANLANALDVDGDGDHDGLDDDDGDDSLHEDSAAKAAQQLEDKEPSKMRRSGGGPGMGSVADRGARYTGHEEDDGGGGDDEDIVRQVDEEDKYIPRKSKKRPPPPEKDDDDEFDEAEMLSKIGSLPRGFDDGTWEEVVVQDGAAEQEDDEEEHAEEEIGGAELEEDDGADDDDDDEESQGREPEVEEGEDEEEEEEEEDVVEEKTELEADADDDDDDDDDEDEESKSAKSSKRRKMDSHRQTTPVEDVEDHHDAEERHHAWHSWQQSASDSPVRYYRTHDGKEVDICTASDKDCHDHHIKRGDVEVRYRRVKGKPRGSGIEEEEEEENQAATVHRHSQAAAHTAGHTRSKPPSAPHVPVPKSSSGTALGHPPVPKSYYRKAGITSRDDNRIRGRLDDADLLLAENRLDEALTAFKELITLYKDSPRAHYGYAQVLDLQSERRQSNPLLEQSIDAYETLLNLPNVPDELYLLTSNRFVNRCRFRGSMHRALKVQRETIDKFPDNLALLNDYGITFLMIGRNADAKKVFQDVLRLDPNNAIAQVHYGFILKTIDNDIAKGVEYLLKGVQSGLEATQEGRFYYHLGEGLQRLERNAEALEIYKKGADKGIFISVYQRSLYNVDSLKSQPWWTLQDTGYQKQLKTIEKQWKIIRAEGLALLNEQTNTFDPEDEKLTDKGDWKQFTLYQRGSKIVENCRKAPRTCQAVEKLPEAITCKRGQIKFSVMEAGTRVYPHCGPTNCRIRSHLGLVVPNGPEIRVGNETRTWTEGKFIIFDDSFEHEVWHDGDSVRLVLIVDFWHPDLTPEQKKSLAPI